MYHSTRSVVVLTQSEVNSLLPLLALCLLRETQGRQSRTPERRNLQLLWGNQVRLAVRTFWMIICKRPKQHREEETRHWLELTRQSLLKPLKPPYSILSLPPLLITFNLRRPTFERSVPLHYLFFTF